MDTTANITVVGSANVDFFIAVDRLPMIGETMGCKSIEVKSGGKAANQAAACSLLGAKTKFVAQVGGDPYAEMLYEGIMMQHNNRSPKPRRGSFYCNESAGCVLRAGVYLFIPRRRQLYHHFRRCECCMGH